MTMTKADRLRQSAREVLDNAWCVRWTNPREFRRLNAIAADLLDIADHLPPERTEP